MTKTTTRYAPSKKLSDADTVALYIKKLEHPLMDEIEAVRKIIKSANKKISERIKWNAPSYYYKNDLVTFHVQAQQYIHLVFHHPAITTIKSPLLEGDYKDRRMTYFHNMQEVKSHAKELERIINELVKLMDA